MYLLQVNYIYLEMLIAPSSKTDGGHRLYSDDDMLKLERVLAMKEDPYMMFI